MMTNAPHPALRALPTPRAAGEPEHAVVPAGRCAPARRRPPAPTRPAVARLGALALAAALAAVAAPLGAQPAGEPVAPQPTLPRITLQAGLHVIRAEVADTGERRRRGLMMRERLGPNEGMLFVFEFKAGHCFWMKDTVLPLSIAFVDDDGTIANIEDMSPRSEDSHCPVRPIRYALEMEQGWFTRRGIRAGSKLVEPTLFPSTPKR